jgi:cell division protein FtsL
MSKAVNDNLEITLNIKWLVQLVVIIGSMVGAWYSVKMSLNAVIMDVEDLRDKVEMQYEDVHGRLQVLENARNEQLSEMNKSLWQKTFGKDE